LLVVALVTRFVDVAAADVGRHVVWLFVLEV
jgi:hypothetical protein